MLPGSPYDVTIEYDDEVDMFVIICPRCYREWGETRIVVAGQQYPTEQEHDVHTACPQCEQPVSYRARIYDTDRT